MSRKTALAKRRKEQQKNKSEAKKIIAEDSYKCVLEEFKHATSRAGNSQFVGVWKIMKGKETNTEFRGKKIIQYFTEHLAWKMEMLDDLMDQLGADLDWIDEQDNTEDAIVDIFDAALMEKGWVINAKRKKDNDQENNYYFNEVPACLEGEDPFGKEVRGAEDPEVGEDEDEVEEKPKAKKKPAKKAKKPEPEPEEDEEEDDEPEEKPAPKKAKKAKKEEPKEEPADEEDDWGDDEDDNEW